MQAHKFYNKHYALRKYTAQVCFFQEKIEAIVNDQT